MRKLNKVVANGLILCLLCLSVRVNGQAVDDKFTQIAPNNPGKDSQEFVHGQGYGKILMRVMIFGSVPHQGVHYVPEGTDLLFAMLYAGGYSETSKLNEITIRRKAVTDLMEVDLEALIEDGRPVPKLVDGDVITVPWNWRKDIATISLITGFVSAMTGFTLSVIALTRH